MIAARPLACSATIYETRTSNQLLWSTTPDEHLTDFVLRIHQEDTGAFHHFYLHKYVLYSSPHVSEYIEGLMRFYGADRNGTTLDLSDADDVKVIPLILDIIYLTVPVIDEGGNEVPNHSRLFTRLQEFDMDLIINFIRVCNRLLIFGGTHHIIPHFSERFTIDKIVSLSKILQDNDVVCKKWYLERVFAAKPERSLPQYDDALDRSGILPNLIYLLNKSLEGSMCQLSVELLRVAAQTLELFPQVDQNALVSLMRILSQDYFDSETRYHVQEAMSQWISKPVARSILLGNGIIGTLSSRCRNMDDDDLDSAKEIFDSIAESDTKPSLDMLQSALDSWRNIESMGEWSDPLLYAFGAFVTMCLSVGDKKLMQLVERVTLSPTQQVLLDPIVSEYTDLNFRRRTNHSHGMPRLEPVNITSPSYFDRLVPISFLSNSSTIAILAGLDKEIIHNSLVALTYIATGSEYQIRSIINDDVVQCTLNGVLCHCGPSHVNFAICCKLLLFLLISAGDFEEALIVHFFDCRFFTERVLSIFDEAGRNPREAVAIFNRSGSFALQVNLACKLLAIKKELVGPSNYPYLYIHEILHSKQMAISGMGLPRGLTPEHAVLSDRSAELFAEIRGACLPCHRFLLDP